MSFTLLSGIAPFAVAFFVIAALALVVTAGAIVADLARNRTVRVRRHETVRHYYGHLALGR